MIRLFVAVFTLVLSHIGSLGAAPPVIPCPCDHAKPETLKARVCSLCGTAATQTGDVYFLKDINPSKPNRYLALPKAHESGVQAIGQLPDGLRTQLWREAIVKAKELFGERWGLAHNGHFFRTQCHAHLHMGPLSPEVEEVNGKLYDDPKDFPVTADDQGIWVHPKDKRYCVHLDRDLTEVVLIR
jgi:diadenosine tetraphosphate (Ap4A) HIT family hydrolase